MALSPTYLSWLNLSAKEDSYPSRFPVDHVNYTIFNKEEAVKKSWADIFLFAFIGFSLIFSMGVTIQDLTRKPVEGAPTEVMVGLLIAGVIFLLLAIITGGNKIINSIADYIRSKRLSSQ